MIDSYMYIYNRIVEKSAHLAPRNGEMNITANGQHINRFIA